MLPGNHLQVTSSFVLSIKLFGIQKLDDLHSPHFLCPRERSRPRFGITLDRVGATRQQELYQIHSSPAARPSERRTPEQVVPNVESCAGIEQHRRKLQTNAVISRDDFMHHRLATV